MHLASPPGFHTRIIALLSSRLIAFLPDSRMTVKHPLRKSVITPLGSDLGHISATDVGLIVHILMWDEFLFVQVLSAPHGVITQHF
jgi:hypothetical protein